MLRFLNVFSIVLVVFFVFGCSEAKPKPKAESVTHAESVRQVPETKQTLKNTDGPDSKTESLSEVKPETLPASTGKGIQKQSVQTGSKSKPESKKAVKSEPKLNFLKVGMAVHYPPLAFKYKGKLQGIEVDFANALAKELDRPVQITVLPWLQLPHALETKAIDIVMAGSSITESRKKHMLFSEPYMKISQMAVMRLGTETPNPFTKGKGMKIGFADFTTGEKFVNEMFPMADKRGFTTLEQGVVAVMNREIDYFFHDSPSIWYYTATHSIGDLMGWYVPYTDEDLAWAFNRNNMEFKKQVDKILLKWKNDGTVQRIIRKWIPVTISTPQGSDPLRF
jgi:polar amino acid transport system substrate-binding protein